MRYIFIPLENLNIFIFAARSHFEENLNILLKCMMHDLEIDSPIY